MFVAQHRPANIEGYEFVFPVLVAGGVLALDYVFHLLFTHPMETVFYFVGVKFIGGVLFTWFVLFSPQRPNWDLVVTSVVFGLVVSIYYAFAGVAGYRSDLYAHPVPVIHFLVAPLNTYAWPLVHAAMFWLAFNVAAFVAVLHKRAGTKT